MGTPGYGAPYPPGYGPPPSSGYGVPGPPGGWPSRPLRDDVAAAGGPPGSRRKARSFGLIALAAVGIAALGGGITGLVWAYTRKPTPAQVTDAGNRLSAQQWRGLSAGQIFPSTVAYWTTFNIRTRATLVGIAPQESCALAFDAATVRVLDKDGCVTVLRATYTDASDTQLATIGIAVMTNAAAADKADSDLGPGSSGVLPVSFPGTIAAGFTRQGREVFGLQATGRYVVFYTAGYSDGRKAVTSSGTVSMDLAAGVAAGLADGLAAPSSPCASREVRCGS